MYLQILLACLGILVNAAQLEARGYATTLVPSPTYAGCAYESCLYSTKLPAAYRPIATDFCTSLVGHVRYGGDKTTITVTSTTVVSIIPTVIVTRTLIVDPLPITVIITVTTTSTSTFITTSTATSTKTGPNTTITPSNCITKRDADAGYYKPPKTTAYPSFMTQGCKHGYPPLYKISSACSCYLSTGTIITTTTITTITNVGPPFTQYTDITIRPDPPTFYTTITTTVTAAVFSTTVVTTTTTVPGGTVVVPCPSRATTSRGYYGYQ